VVVTETKKPEMRLLASFFCLDTGRSARKEKRGGSPAAQLPAGCIFHA